MTAELSERAPMFRLSRSWLWWLVLIAIGVRMACMVVLQSWDFKSNRAFGYEAGEIGSALAEGLGFSWPYNSTYNVGKPPEPTSWEGPVYPLIIAGAFKVFGTYSVTSAVFLIIFQTAISALICVLLFLIGRRVFNEEVGIIAAFMLAFYPMEVHLAVQKIGVTTLCTAMLLLSIFQLLCLADSPWPRKSFLAGLPFGIAVLSSPAIISFIPFALIWLLLRGRAQGKALIIGSMFFIVGVCGPILPWQVRNYSVFGEIMFVKSNLTRELFQGNYGNAKSIVEENQSKAALDEGQRSKLYLNKFLDSIVNNPAALVRLSWERFVQFWTAAPMMGGPNYTTDIDLKTRLAGVSYFFVLILGVVGLCLTRLKVREVQLLALAILTLPIAYYLTWFTRFRYRFPVETILIVFASYACYLLLNYLRAKKKPVATR